MVLKHGLSKNAAKKNQSYALVPQLIAPLLIIFIILLLCGCSSETVTTIKNIPTNAASAYNDTKDFISGLKLFFEKLSTIASLIGFKTIVLLIAVLFISSGLSAIGVPKGRFSFFLSLAVADAIWILWKSSFGESASYWPIVQSTLILSLPFLLILLIKKAVPKIRPRLKNVFARFTKQDIQIKRGEIRLLLRQFLEKSTELHNNIQENMDNDTASLGLSAITSREISEIKKILDSIEKKNRRKKNKGRHADEKT